MQLSQAKEIHEYLEADQWPDAANYVLGLVGKPARIETKAQSLKVCQGLFNHLLDNGLYLQAATLQWGPRVFLAEPESVRRSFEAVHNHAKVLIMGASSLGKCLGRDTPVLLYSGQAVMVQDVRVGDKLMGPDGTPRNVLSTTQGRSKLYRINPERGDSWVCNDSHILSLKISSTKICGNSNKPSKKTFKGGIIDIPIEEYLALGSSRKNILKQFHVGVELPEQPLEIDPYVYGSWLGDGGTDVPALHTPGGPMSDYWCKYFTEQGYRIHVGYREKSCQMFCVRKPAGSGKNNQFLSFIRTSVIQEKKEKFIREEYLLNSRKNRLALLAGLIDSDGYVHSKTSYSFCTKFPALSRQVMLLARSLGLAACIRPKVCTIKSIGFSSTYYNVQISGSGILEIPTLEKHAKESSSVKNLTNTGFSVEDIGVGDYYGFSVDGDHRFLLGDYTVTHNSYGIGAWMTLDYLRAPLYTSVKLAAISEKHLKENLYPHVCKLVRNCIIPPTVKIDFKESDLWMGVKEAGFEFGISGLAFKQSQETSGQFKGYKAMPVMGGGKRKGLDGSTRLRVLLDEAQNVPGGPFQDFNSLTASISGVDRIKIVCAFNPENTSCKVVQMAEPEQGWLADDLEKLYDYDSKAGWRVCRLDAAKCENVIQKKVIYENLQSYEGYLGYLKAGGDNSPAYFCFARGFPPMVGTVNTIIPPSWPQSQRGEVTFVEPPTDYAAVDLAFMGKDSAQMAVGRWGLASGWRDWTGKFHSFKDRLDVAKNKPHYVLQVDNILPLAKHDNTVTMAEEIIGRCKMLRIKPESVAIDKTGYGFGVHGHLTKVWGDVFGVAWNEKATERKIVAEDTEGADKQCDGVMSEMWWAFRRWLDPRAEVIFFNPIIPTQPIQTQLTSRRYKSGSKGIKVEPKEEYMARSGGISPDESDSLVMLVHAVRRNSDVIPGLVQEQAPKKDSKEGGLVFESAAKMRSVEADDSISVEGEGVY